MEICNWTPSCSEPAVEAMECQTRPGLIIDVVVCEGHQAVAGLHGYRVRLERGAAQRKGLGDPEPNNGGGGEST